MSPQKISCSNCSELLYAGLEIETPSEIIQRYSGHCPKCQNKLVFTIEKLKIHPVTVQPSQ